VKKVAGLFLMALCLMLLMCSAAMANDLEDYPKVDASRLSIEVPEGIVLAEKMLRENGKVGVVVDVENTDWRSVIINGGFPNLMFSSRIERPDAKYDSCCSFNGSILSVAEDPNLGVQYMIDYIEHEISRNFDDIIGNNHTIAGNGIEAGKIEGNFGVFSPWSHRFDGGMFICWLDKEDPSARYYEWFVEGVSYTIDEPFYVPFKYLSAESMAPTLDQNMTNVKIQEIKKGGITYRLTKDVERVTLPLALNAPDGAERLLIKWDHGREETVRFNKNNDVIVWNNEVYMGKNVLTETMMLVWYDGNDNILDYGILLYNCAPKEVCRPWPTYEEDEGNWFAPSEDRVTLVNGSEALGITFEYDEDLGLAHVDYDANAEMTGDLGKIELWVAPYAGATAYRMNGGGGNTIFYEDISGDVVAGQEFITSRAELHILKEGEKVKVIDTHPLTTVKVGPATIYKQTGEVWPYGGGVHVIFWYKDEQAAIDEPEKPLRIEYICDTNGTMSKISKTPMLESEDEIKKPVTEVTCIGPYADKGWNLVIERYPQKGGDTFLYELHLENNRGGRVEPGEPLIIYMPYPKGHNSDNHDYIYQLVHYSDEYENYQDYELVEVEETEYGIRFVIESFSSFVLDWSGWEDDGSGNNPNPNPDPDEPDDPGHDEPQNGRTFHQVFLESNHKAQVRGGHFGNINVSIAGQSFFENSLIDMIVIMPYPQDGWATDIDHGMHLTGKTKVNTLVMTELEIMAQEMSGISRPLISFDDQATLDRLEIMGDCTFFNPAWIQGDVPEKVFIEEFGRDMSYDEFLAYIGYTN